MKKFQFRLDSVLSVRRTHERLRQEEMARSVRREREEEERLRTVETIQQEALSTGMNTDVDVHGALLHGRYRARLADLVRRQRTRVAEAARRTEMSRDDLVEAARERTVVENLKDRRRLEHRAAAGREEQKGLDEIAGRLVRGEEGSAVVTILIVVVLYVVLFLGLLKVTGVLDRQILPRLKGQPPAATAAADSLGFPDGDLDAAVKVAEVKRLAAERDSVVAMSHRLDLKAKELEGRIAELRRLMADASPVSETPDKYGDLALVYAAMKPNQLKPIVAALDEETLYGVMVHLKGRQLGQLLGLMEPSRAALLSERLAMAGVESR